MKQEDKPPLIKLALILAFIALMVVGVANGSKTPETSNESDKMGCQREGCDLDYRYITGNSIIAPKIQYKKQKTLGSLITSDLVDCVWKRESSRGKNMFGDYKNGEPRAYGHFQIWLSVHPITYECAMDFECSSNYFKKKVSEGKGYLWTTYEECIK